jgi:hypothetical protein
MTEILAPRRTASDAADIAREAAEASPAIISRPPHNPPGPPAMSSPSRTRRPAEPPAALGARHSVETALLPPLLLVLPPGPFRVWP